MTLPSRINHTGAGSTRPRRPAPTRRTADTSARRGRPQSRRATAPRLQAAFHQSPDRTDDRLMGTRTISYSLLGLPATPPRWTPDPPLRPDVHLGEPRPLLQSVTPSHLAVNFGSPPRVTNPPGGRSSSARAAGNPVRQRHRYLRACSVSEGLCPHSASVSVAAIEAGLGSAALLAFSRIKRMWGALAGSGFNPAKPGYSRKAR
jgi:hypothetical protein